MKSVKMLMKQKMDTKHYYMLPPVWMDIGDYWKNAIRNRAQACPKCLARLKHVEYFTRYSYENHSLNQRLVIEIRLMASQYEKHVRGIMLHVDRSDCIPKRTRPPGFVFNRMLLTIYQLVPDSESSHRNYTMTFSDSSLGPTWAHANWSAVAFAT